jgi:hypothetical protein
MAKQQSRPKRWAAACVRASAAFEKLEAALGEVESSCSDLNDLRQEYSDWRDNLSENLQSSPVAEKLDAVLELEFEDIHSELESAISEKRGVIEEASAIDLPQGFGRD